MVRRRGDGVGAGREADAWIVGRFQCGGGGDAWV